MNYKYSGWQNRSGYKQKILDRDNRTCQICGATEAEGARLEVDHIIPFTVSHDNSETNLRASCTYCNRLTRQKRKDSALSHDEYMVWLRAEIAKAT